MKSILLTLFVMLSSIISQACDWNNVKQNAEQTAIGFCANSNGLSDIVVSLGSVVRDEMRESQIFVNCKNGTKLIGSIDYDLDSLACKFSVTLGPVTPL